MDHVYERPLVITILTIVMSCIGLIGNFLVCLTILRVKFLQDLTHYLILNLAISDLLTCLMFLTHRVLERADLHQQLDPSIVGASVYMFVYCHLIFSGYLFYSFSYVSVYNLLIITLERYIVIVYPLRYVQFYTKRRACLAIATAWTAGFCNYLIHLVGVQVDTVNTSVNYCTYTHSWAWHFLPFTAGFLLPLAAMILTYARIIKMLKRSAWRQQAVPRHAVELIQARRRVVNLMLIITATFVLLYGATQPSYMITVMMYKDTYETAKDANSLKCFLMYLLTDVPIMLNCVVNPIVYAFKYKKFRKGMREGFCPCLKSAQVSPTRSKISTIKKTNNDSSC